MKDIKNRLTELNSLRDELKVRMHLATLDTRDAWDKIEPKLESLGHQIEHGKDVAMDEVNKALEQIGAAMKSIKTQLENRVGKN